MDEYKKEKQLHWTFEQHLVFQTELLIASCSVLGGNSWSEGYGLGAEVWGPFLLPIPRTYSWSEMERILLQISGPVSLKISQAVKLRKHSEMVCSVFSPLANSPPSTKTTLWFIFTACCYIPTTKMWFTNCVGLIQSWSNLWEQRGGLMAQYSSASAVFTAPLLPVWLGVSLRSAKH